MKRPKLIPLPGHYNTISFNIHAYHRGIFTSSPVCAKHNLIAGYLNTLKDKLVDYHTEYNEHIHTPDDIFTACKNAAVTYWGQKMQIPDNLISAFTTPDMMKNYSDNIAPFVHAGNTL